MTNREFNDQINYVLYWRLMTPLHDRINTALDWRLLNRLDAIRERR